MIISSSAERPVSSAGDRDSSAVVPSGAHAAACAAPFSTCAALKLVEFDAPPPPLPPLLPAAEVASEPVATPELAKLEVNELAGVACDAPTADCAPMPGVEPTPAPPEPLPALPESVKELICAETPTGL